MHPTPLPCPHLSIHHQIVTLQEKGLIKSLGWIKPLDLKYFANRNYFSHQNSHVSQFIFVFLWSRIMVTLNLLAVSRKPGSGFLICVERIPDKAIGIQNEGS